MAQLISIAYCQLHRSAGNAYAIQSILNESIFHRSISSIFRYDDKVALTTVASSKWYIF